MKQWWSGSVRGLKKVKQGMALRMDRSLATGRDSEGNSRWLELPPWIPGCGNTGCEGQESSRLFPVRRVESRLWTAYQQDQRARLGGCSGRGCLQSYGQQDRPASHQGLANSSTGPHQRNEQTYCQGGRGSWQTRQGGASSSQQGGKGRSEYMEIRVDEKERPTPGEPSSGSRKADAGYKQLLVVGCRMCPSR